MGDGYVTNNFDVLSLCFVGEDDSSASSGYFGHDDDVDDVDDYYDYADMMMMRANNRVEKIPRRKTRGKALNYY